jgi:amylosucrase
VVANFDANPQYLELSNLRYRSLHLRGTLQDLHTGETPRLFNDRLVVPPYRFYWLSNLR